MTSILERAIFKSAIGLPCYLVWYIDYKRDKSVGNNDHFFSVIQYLLIYLYLHCLYHIYLLIVKRFLYLLMFQFLILLHLHVICTLLPLKAVIIH